MSGVRMCDRCGRIFAEGIEGSAVGTVTVMVKNERTGRTQPEQQTQDQCPACAGGGKVEPRLPALESGESVQTVTKVDRGHVH